MPHSLPSTSLNQYPDLQLIRGGRSDDAEPVTGRFVKVPVEVVFNTTLSPWARLVYCALESHKGERGIFPRQEVLAKELGTSTDTVGRALKELRAKQLIEVDRQGRGHANRYSLSHDSAPVRNHKPDDTASVRDQNEHDSASLRELETAPMRNPETAPVRNPIRTIPSELELKELEGVNPQTPTTVKPSKKSKDDDYPAEMMAFWDACSTKARQRSTKDEVATEWRKINPDAATAEKILDSVRAWNQTDDFVRGYAQGAHRFLKSGKWKELPEADDVPPKETNGYHSPASSTADAFRVVREAAAKRAAQRTAEPADVFETTGVVR